jgi:hypothetical protein
MRIAEVENVNAFRRLVIALPGFRANRISAEGDLIRFDHSPVADQLQSALLLKDDNPIGVQGRNRRLRRAQPT